jgi:hypothetical protein
MGSFMIYNLRQIHIVRVIKPRMNRREGDTAAAIHRHVVNVFDEEYNTFIRNPPEEDLLVDLEIYGRVLLNRHLNE